MRRPHLVTLDIAQRASWVTADVEILAALKF